MVPSTNTSVILNKKRLRALETTGLWDSSPNQDLDRLTKLTGYLLNAPIVFLTLVGANRHYYISVQGVEESVLVRDQCNPMQSFCQHVVRTK